MNRWLRWTPLLLLPLAAFMVHEGNKPVVVPGVFRWRNDSRLDHGEYTALTEKRFQRVYLKVLDIDWNPLHGAHPISHVPVPRQWRDYHGHSGPLTESIEFVPCIYITNNTFLKIDDRQAAELGHNLLRKLRMEMPDKVHGVMLDCDWTASTQARFFRLVRMMRDSLDVPLTATIRLHQYAAPKKTGVPPADRGMLMVYNVGHVEEAGAINSIFDKDLAAPYFARNTKYPLPLDIALPAYSCGVQFRNGRFIGLLHDDQVRIAQEWRLLGPAVNGVCQVVSERSGIEPELHIGDEVRLETMTPELMEQAAALASKAMNSDTLCVTFFELGARALGEMSGTTRSMLIGHFGAERSEGPDRLIANEVAGSMTVPVADTVAVDTAR